MINLLIKNFQLYEIFQEKGKKKSKPSQVSAPALLMGHFCIIGAVHVWVEKESTS